MNPVMITRQGRKGEASQVTAKAPTCLKTTLYDKIAALQSGVEPAEDDLVVAIMVRGLRTRRLTLVGDVPAAAEKEEMAMVRKGHQATPQAGAHPLSDAVGTIVSTSESQIFHRQHV